MINSPIRQTRRGKSLQPARNRRGGHCCQCTEGIGGRTTVGSACVRHIQSAGRLVRSSTFSKSPASGNLCNHL